MAELIPDLTGDPRDDVQAELVGETVLHRCRVLAAGRAGRRLEIHLLAASAERLDPVRPRGPGSRRPDIALRHRFAFTFETVDDAVGEEVVVDHWGENGILVEVHLSALRQGILLFDPGTGVSTGMRLPLDGADQAHRARSSRSQTYGDVGDGR